VSSIYPPLKAPPPQGPRGANLKTLPRWDVRLRRFLTSHRAPWPLQWCVGRHGVACVRCGERLDGVGEVNIVPACTACKRVVAAVVAEYPLNDWTKRYRRVVEDS